LKSIIMSGQVGARALRENTNESLSCGDSKTELPQSILRLHYVNKTLYVHVIENVKRSSKIEIITVQVSARTLHENTNESLSCGDSKTNLPQSILQLHYVNKPLYVHVIENVKRNFKIEIIT